MAHCQRLVLGALVILQFSLFVCGTKYLVTLPKVLHYDTEVVATVTAVDVPAQGDNIRIRYKGATDTSRTFNSTTLHFQKDGDQTWGVAFSWKRMQEFHETGVTFEIGNVDKKLQFNPDSGFIFIQTDKPIYTPGQTVKFRIIAVNEDQKLSKYQLKVDIRNPGNIIVDRMRYSAEDAFKAQTFELPREATIGVWNISASFEGLAKAYSSTKVVEFEVREYVLPRFSADLKVNTDVVGKNTGWVTFHITGRYVYDRPLKGSAELRLGTWDEENGVQLVPHRFQKELEDGEANVHVWVPKYLNQGVFYGGKRLYVTVNVTETGTGENDTIEDTSVYLANPYFDIDFIASDQYFKPGFPFTLKADITSKSGMRHPGTDLFVVILAKDERRQKLEDGSKTKSTKTNKASQLVETFDVPKETATLEILVTVLDYKHHELITLKFSPPKMKSRTKQYMHISMIKKLSMYQKGKLLFLYTPEPRSSTDKTSITVQVLSKGRVVHTASIVKNHDGRTELDLPKNLFYSATPSMRVVAYYYARLGSQAEFVVDSIRVETEKTCKNEVYIDKDRDSFKRPKEKFELTVQAEPDSTVGLLAVDEAVLALNDRQTLTRESFFQDLESHDLGEGAGDGDDLDDILLNSGLEHLFFDTKLADRATVSKIHDILSSHRYNTKATASGTIDIGHRLPASDDEPRWKSRNQEFKKRVASPQTVRKYFPESWLFEEIKIGSYGYEVLPRTYPDSITTWNFMAVSLHPDRGVCVSDPITQKVEKQFFADVRLPYKATRLEEVKIKIAMYNYQTYDLHIHGIVKGDSGICFAANSAKGSSEEGENFEVKVPKKGIMTKEVKIIPLKDGELTIRVDLMALGGKKETDVVEKTLYVVAEGRRVHKSITFVLDPEGKHISYKSSKKDTITMKTSPTINNTFDTKKKEQNTTIDLALPEEVIMGTESCHIAAFGDLMGDIITHAVVQSKSLVDQPIADAEEVLGDLGPTVHALLYINKSGLSNEELDTKGRRFVTHGAARLVKYKEGPFFKVTPKSKPATWLTAAVLKTLCHASDLTFIDREKLIDESFSWLASMVDHTNGSLVELDWRLAEDSFEYRIMLAAEVLISLLECDRVFQEDHLMLMYDTSKFLESNVHKVQQPMVLAKTIHALFLYDHVDPADLADLADRENSEISRAIAKLRRMKLKNKSDQIYWSEKELDDSDDVPFWYQAGAKASSIEATAYALLVMLETKAQREEVDAIADWLVGQRNENGAFIGAMDSMAAIQALSQYSLKKRKDDILEIDLSCNVSSERVHGRHTHSFKFTQQNATSPKSVPNVPVGHKLEVLTKGQGLGQMHVNVGYNVPVDRNANCDFNVTVEVKTVQIRFQEDMSDPMCFACGIGCKDKDSKEDEDEHEREVRYVAVTDRDRDNGRPPVLAGRRDSRGRPILHEPPPPPLPPVTRKRITNTKTITRAKTYAPKPPTLKSRERARKLSPPPVSNPRRRRPGVPKLSTSRRRTSSKRRSRRAAGPSGSSEAAASATSSGSHRERRSPKYHPNASKKSICLHICLQYMHDGMSSGRTTVEVEMLSGYFPVGLDMDRIAKHPRVRNVQYIEQRDLLVVQYDKIASDNKTCFGLRVIDEQEVGRPTPATVVVREANSPQPSCAMEYNPPPGQQSLQVFCANFSNTNRGECKCYSGICSSCLPVNGFKKDYDFPDVKKMACAAEIGYEVKLRKIKDQNQWVEIDATVVHKNKTGSHDIDQYDTIKLMTPSSCRCPHFVHTPNEEVDHNIYLLSSDVEKLVDRGGNAVYRYLLDERSTFMKVSHPRRTQPYQFNYQYLSSAFEQQDNCY